MLGLGPQTPQGAREGQGSGVACGWGGFAGVCLLGAGSSVRVAVLSTHAQAESWWVGGVSSESGFTGRPCRGA